MERSKRIRYLLSLLALAAGASLLFVCNLCIGSVEIRPAQLWSCLAGGHTGSTEWVIVWEIRFPRAAAAMLLGGALGLAGYLLQTFFRNPIAGPFVLGISSGAKMTVAAAMVFFLGRAIRVTSLTLILAAFAGAMMSMGFALLISRRTESMSLLVVGGVMIGYICSAVTEFIVTFAADADIVNLHNWSRGSFSGMTWENVAAIAWIALPASAAVFLLAKPLGAYQLGDAYARNLGVNLRAMRMAMVALSGILSACIVAYAGPVSFVGVATPHLVKRLLGCSKPLLLIPASFLGGSLFCLLCDLLARTLFAPTELSISAVTAVFGAPVTLWVMARRGRRE